MVYFVRNNINTNEVTSFVDRIKIDEDETKVISYLATLDGHKDVFDSASIERVIDNNPNHILLTGYQNADFNPSEVISYTEQENQGNGITYITTYKVLNNGQQGPAKDYLIREQLGENHVQDRAYKDADRTELKNITETIFDNVGGRIGAVNSKFFNKDMVMLSDTNFTYSNEGLLLHTDTDNFNTAGGLASKRTTYFQGTRGREYQQGSKNMKEDGTVESYDIYTSNSENETTSSDTYKPYGAEVQNNQVVITDASARRSTTFFDDEGRAAGSRNYLSDGVNIDSESIYTYNDEDLITHLDSYKEAGLSFEQDSNGFWMVSEIDRRRRQSTTYFAAPGTPFEGSPLAAVGYRSDGDTIASMSKFFMSSETETFGEVIYTDVFKEGGLDLREGLDGFIEIEDENIERRSARSYNERGTGHVVFSENFRNDGTTIASITRNEYNTNQQYEDDIVATFSYRPVGASINEGLDGFFTFDENENARSMTVYNRDSKQAMGSVDFLPSGTPVTASLFRFQDDLVRKIETYDAGEEGLQFNLANDGWYEANLANGAQATQASYLNTDGFTIGTVTYSDSGIPSAIQVVFNDGDGDIDYIDEYHRPNTNIGTQDFFDDETAFLTAGLDLNNTWRSATSFYTDGPNGTRILEHTIRLQEGANLFEEVVTFYEEYDYTEVGGEYVIDTVHNYLAVGTYLGHDKLDGFSAGETHYEYDQNGQIGSVTTHAIAYDGREVNGGVVSYNNPDVTDDGTTITIYEDGRPVSATVTGQQFDRGHDGVITRTADYNGYTIFEEGEALFSRKYGVYDDGGGHCAGGGECPTSYFEEQKDYANGVPTYTYSLLVDKDDLVTLSETWLDPIYGEIDPDHYPATKGVNASGGSYTSVTTFTNGVAVQTETTGLDENGAPYVGITTYDEVTGLPTLTVTNGGEQGEEYTTTTYYTPEGLVDHSETTGVGQDENGNPTGFTSSVEYDEFGNPVQSIAESTGGPWFRTTTTYNRDEHGDLIELEENGYTYSIKVFSETQGGTTTLYLDKDGKYVGYVQSEEGNGSGEYWNKIFEWRNTSDCPTGSCLWIYWRYGPQNQMGQAWVFDRNQNLVEINDPQFGVLKPDWERHHGLPWVVDEDPEVWRFGWQTLYNFIDVQEQYDAEFGQSWQEIIHSEKIPYIENDMNNVLDSLRTNLKQALEKALDPELLDIYDTREQRTADAEKTRMQAIGQAADQLLQAYKTYIQTIVSEAQSLFSDATSYDYVGQFIEATNAFLAGVTEADQFAATDWAAQAAWIDTLIAWMSDPNDPDSLQRVLDDLDNSIQNITDDIDQMNDGGNPSGSEWDAWRQHKQEALDQIQALIDGIEAIKSLNLPTEPPGPDAELNDLLDAAKAAIEEMKQILETGAGGFGEGGALQDLYEQVRDALEQTKQSLQSGFDGLQGGLEALRDWYQSMADAKTTLDQAWTDYDTAKQNAITAYMTALAEWCGQNQGRCDNNEVRLIEVPKYTSFESEAACWEELNQTCGDGQHACSCTCQDDPNDPEGDYSCTWKWEEETIGDYFKKNFNHAANKEDLTPFQIFAQDQEKTMNQTIHDAWKDYLNAFSDYAGNLNSVPAEATFGSIAQTYSDMMDNAAQTWNDLRDTVGAGIPEFFLDDDKALVDMLTEEATRYLSLAHERVNHVYAYYYSQLEIELEEANYLCGQGLTEYCDTAYTIQNVKMPAWDNWRDGILWDGENNIQDLLNMTNDAKWLVKSALDRLPYSNCNMGRGYSSCVDNLTNLPYTLRNYARQVRNYSQGFDAMSFWFDMTLYEYETALWYAASEAVKISGGDDQYNYGSALYYKVMAINAYAGGWTEDARIIKETADRDAYKAFAETFNNIQTTAASRLETALTACRGGSVNYDCDTAWEDGEWFNDNLGMWCNGDNQYRENCDNGSVNDKWTSGYVESALKWGSSACWDSNHPNESACANIYETKDGHVSLQHRGEDCGPLGPGNGDCYYHYHFDETKVWHVKTTDWLSQYDDATWWKVDGYDGDRIHHGEVEKITQYEWWLSIAEAIYDSGLGGGYWNAHQTYQAALGQNETAYQQTLGQISNWQDGEMQAVDQSEQTIEDAGIILNDAVIAYYDALRDADGQRDQALQDAADQFYDDLNDYWDDPENTGYDGEVSPNKDTFRAWLDDFRTGVVDYVGNWLWNSYSTAWSESVAQVEYEWGYCGSGNGIIGTLCDQRSDALQQIAESIFNAWESYCEQMGDTQECVNAGHTGFGIGTIAATYNQTISDLQSMYTACEQFINDQTQYDSCMAGVDQVAANALEWKNSRENQATDFLINTLNDLIEKEDEIHDQFDERITGAEEWKQEILDEINTFYDDLLDRILLAHDYMDDMMQPIYEYLDWLDQNNQDMDFNEAWYQAIDLVNAAYAWYMGYGDEFNNPVDEGQGGCSGCGVVDAEYTHRVYRVNDMLDKAITGDPAHDFDGLMQAWAWAKLNGEEARSLGEDTTARLKAWYLYGNTIFDRRLFAPLERAGLVFRSNGKRLQQAEVGLFYNPTSKTYERLPTSAVYGDLEGNRFSFDNNGWQWNGQSGSFEMVDAHFELRQYVEVSGETGAVTRQLRIFTETSPEMRTIQAQIATQFGISLTADQFATVFIRSQLNSSFQFGNGNILSIQFNPASPNFFGITFGNPAEQVTSKTFSLDGNTYKLQNVQIRFADGKVYDYNVQTNVYSITDAMGQTLIFDHGKTYLLAKAHGLNIMIDLSQIDSIGANLQGGYTITGDNLVPQIFKAEDSKQNVKITVQIDIHGNLEIISARLPGADTELKLVSGALGFKLLSFDLTTGQILDQNLLGGFALNNDQLTRLAHLGFAPAQFALALGADQARFDHHTLQVKQVIGKLINGTRIIINISVNGEFRLQFQNAGGSILREFSLGTNIVSFQRLQVNPMTGQDIQSLLQQFGNNLDSATRNQILGEVLAGTQEIFIAAKAIRAGPNGEVTVLAQLDVTTHDTYQASLDRVNTFLNLNSELLSTLAQKIDPTLSLNATGINAVETGFNFSVTFQFKNAQGLVIHGFMASPLQIALALQSDPISLDQFMKLVAQNPAAFYGAYAQFAMSQIQSIAGAPDTIDGAIEVLERLNVRFQGSVENFLKAIGLQNVSINDILTKPEFAQLAALLGGVVTPEIDFTNISVEDFVAKFNVINTSAAKALLNAIGPDVRV
ncbi:MAG: hypothetical protein COW12_01105, partial [Candidatus Omnitrophica bacterium CG12_big_fil_rev_8_21_14_0_65_45_16]